MNRVVVDASVAVKWVIEEPYSDTAERLLTRDTELHAPSHWLAEVATAIWAKAAIHGVLGEAAALERIELIHDVTVTETPIRTLLPAASSLAFSMRLTVYDTLYLALARRLAVSLVTADRKLFDRAAGEAGLVVWVGDLPA